MSDVQEGDIFKTNIYYNKKPCVFLDIHFILLDTGIWANKEFYVDIAFDVLTTDCNKNKVHICFWCFEYQLLVKSNTFLWSSLINLCISSIFLSIYCIN